MPEHILKCFPEELTVFKVKIYYLSYCIKRTEYGDIHVMSQESITYKD